LGSPHPSAAFPTYVITQRYVPHWGAAIPRFAMAQK